MKTSDVVEKMSAILVIEATAIIGLTSRPEWHACGSLWISEAEATELRALEWARPAPIPRLTRAQVFGTLQPWRFGSVSSVGVGTDADLIGVAAIEAVLDFMSKAETRDGDPRDEVSWSLAVAALEHVADMTKPRYQTTRYTLSARAALWSRTS